MAGVPDSDGLLSAEDEWGVSKANSKLVSRKSSRQTVLGQTAQELVLLMYLEVI